MTQEEKSLLLQDLCARLSYGCYLYVEGPKRLPDNEHISVGFIGGYALNKDGCQDFLINDVLEDLDNGSIVKLILRPMSSMTEEEKNDLRNEHIKDEQLFTQCIAKSKQGDNTMRGKVIPHFAADWCNKNHFDYRGLIPMGLALEATKDMYQK